MKDYPNTAYYIEIEATRSDEGDYGYRIVEARKEATDDGATTAPALIPQCNPFGECLSGRAAFWFIVEGHACPVRSDPNIRWFDTAINPNLVLAACVDADDWMNRQLVVA